MKKPKQLVHQDLREVYGDTLLAKWKGRDMAAMHRFVPADTDDTVRMNLTMGGNPHSTQADVVIESYDGGENWQQIDGWYPPCDRGIYSWGRLRMSIVKGGQECWRSYDDGQHWHRHKIDNANELHLKGLGAPNCFSAIMIRHGNYSGRIVMVADYFMGQEGPDGQLIGTTYSDDWGDTWHCSRMFAPPDPLPFGPEGFGEPAVVEMPSGWLWMVARSLYGELWQAISRDGGTTWLDATPTGFVSPIANCYAVREPTTGATVLSWNAVDPGTSPDFRARHSLYQPRNNLVFAVSHDNTRTWTEPVVVDAGQAQYPTIHFAAGRMFIMYQSSPGDEMADWTEQGLTLVAYDTKEILELPAWNIKTIQPWIASGLVRHWRAVACQTIRDTIS